MKIKALCSALLLVGTLGLATAAPVLSSSTVALVADAHGGWSAGISKTHTKPGLFTDVYVLGGVQGLSLVNGLLQTAGGPAVKDIDFIDISINGVMLDLEKFVQGNFVDFREIASLPDSMLSSPFVLTINGNAGQGLPSTSRISASYSGTINFNAVPEPTGYALIGVALLAAGLASRRRPR